MKANEWIQIVGSSQIEAVLIGMIPGDSSFVDLSVRFKKGSTYTYTDVPTDVAEGLVTADSAGKYLNANIKGKYSYIKGAS